MAVLIGIEANGLVGEVTNRFVTVALYTDDAGSPGTFISVLGIIPDASVDTLPTQIKLTLSTPIPLAPNTRYWIQLSDTTGSAIQWAIAGDSSGVGVSTEATPYQMQVLSQVAAIAFGSVGEFVSNVNARIIGVKSPAGIKPPATPDPLITEQTVVLDGITAFGNVAPLTVEIDVKAFGVSATGLAGEATNRYLTVSLYSDNAGVPDALIAVLGIIPDAWIHGTTSVKLTLAIPIQLDANTRYWVQLTDDSGTQIKWAVAGDSSGTGVPDEGWDASGIVGDNTTSAYQMRVLVDQSSGIGAVGEVGSLAAAVVGTIQGAAASGQTSDLIAVAGEGEVGELSGVTATGLAGSPHTYVSGHHAQSVFATGAVGSVRTYVGGHHAQSVFATGEVGSVIASRTTTATINIRGVSGNGRVSPVLAETPIAESVEVALYSDNDGTPGTLIAVLGTVFDSDITGTEIVEFDVSGIDLDPTTRYWIILTGSDGTQISWVQAADDVGTGVNTEYWVSLAKPIFDHLLTEDGGHLLTEDGSLIGMDGPPLDEYLLTEDGDNLVLEDGSLIGLEKPPVDDYLLTEDGDHLLSEDGSFIGLQEPVPNAFGPSYQMQVLADESIGVTGTGEVGTITAKIDVLTDQDGVEASGEAGAITAFAGTVADISGVGGDGEAGDIIPAIDTVELGGVEGTGEAGDLKTKVSTRRGGRGAPRRGDPTPAKVCRRETEAEMLRRWRELVDELLGIKPKDEEEKPEELVAPAACDFSFLASLEKPEPEIDEPEPEEVTVEPDLPRDKWREMAEAEDLLLLSDMLGEADQLREAEDVLLLGDVI